MYVEAVEVIGARDDMGPDIERLVVVLADTSDALG